MSFIRSLYRNIVPENLRQKLFDKRIHKQEQKLIKELTSYFDSGRCPFPQNEVKEVSAYLKTKGLHVFPNAYSDKYSSMQIEVHHDPAYDLQYVLHQNKKLYFKRNWSVELIRSKYAFLLNEQDEQSPHCYLSKDFVIDANSIIADVGVAEGIFVLPYIEKIKHAYLFETDPEWLEALNATFASYKDKISIIHKFVSNMDDDKHIRLDTFFKDKQVDFIKIDVDGAEQELLNGAVTVLKKDQNLKVAICTYHKQNDERDFTSLLQSYGFKTSTTLNFVLFYIEGEFKPPYLRRGLIRAVKTCP